MSDDPEDDDGSGDPFDALDPDEYRDREGDPFSTLGEGPDDSADDPGRTEAGGSDDRDGVDPSGQRDGAGGPDDRDAVPEDPFTYPQDADPAAAGDRGSGADDRESADGRPDEGGETVRSDVGIPSGDPFADAQSDGRLDGETRQGSPFDEEGTFERIDTGEVDPDEVWDDLTSDEAGAAAVEGVDPEEEVEVSKHAYCESCEHFSPPPNVRCTHDGTTILDFVGMENVRVVNCPVVAERRRLGNDDEQ